MPSSILIARARCTTVFNPSTRVSNCGHSGKEIVAFSRSKLKARWFLLPMASVQRGL